MGTVERFKNKLYCSFCGMSEDEVAKLIAGPSVQICDRCITLSAALIADTQETGAAASAEKKEPADG